MTARIYKPARTAMQSGTAKSKEWVLDYGPSSRARSSRSWAGRVPPT